MDCVEFSSREAAYARIHLITCTGLCQPLVELVYTHRGFKHMFLHKFGCTQIWVYPNRDLCFQEAPS